MVAGGIATRRSLSGVGDIGRTGLGKDRPVKAAQGIDRSQCRPRTCPFARRTRADERVREPVGQTGKIIECEQVVVVSPAFERRIGDHAMKSISTKFDSSPPVADTAVYLFGDWFDPIEAAVRDRVRGFIQAMIEGELDEKECLIRFIRL